MRTAAGLHATGLPTNKTMIKDPEDKILDMQRRLERKLAKRGGNSARSVRGRNGDWG